MHADFFLYWGKAKPGLDGAAAFHSLPLHCLDVAATALVYVRQTAPLKNLLMQSFAFTSEAELESWLIFWLALHDVGKFSAAFQSQRFDLLQQLNPAASPHVYTLRHDSLGMVFWDELLQETAIPQGWFGDKAEDYQDGLNFWMRAVTGHHGAPPKENHISLSQHTDQNRDYAAVLAFIAALDTQILPIPLRNLTPRLPHDDFTARSSILSWWLAGLAVLADWIGSNTDFFPYHETAPTNLANYWQTAQDQATAALAKSEIQTRARREVLELRDIFPHIKTPSPLQAWAATVEISPGPQLHLLEDVMGAGKTEAAILLAQRLFVADCADGFFIGLPTMATANAMYARIAKVYQRLFHDATSMVLAHGQSDLVPEFAASVLREGPQENDPDQNDESASARCSNWLADHRKRALLAPAGIGTIDQAMLAVLCRLLEFHATLGGSAILLSATLPQHMKQQLVNAFARGREQGAGALACPAYPLATTWREDAPVCETPLATRPDICRTLLVTYLDSEVRVLDLIRTALQNGQAVCWMRNTVADAMAAHRQFAAELPPERLTLFHARFTLAARLATEQAILRDFGRDSTPAQRAGKLVIATQVAEQSLDADWDVVISDLAPIDRLLQRAGRLQRHTRDVPGGRTPRLYVYGPAYTPEPPANWYRQTLPGAAVVYSKHVESWLTAQLLQEGKIALPGDARRLIEAVFNPQQELPVGLLANADKAQGEDYSDQAQAISNLLNLASGYVRGNMDWWEEGQTPSRLGEASGPVVLLRWQSDTLQPWFSHPNPRAALAYSSVRMALRLIKTSAPDAARQQIIEQWLQSQPGQGKYLVVLPLQESEQGWIGQALDGKGKLRTWRYSDQVGLLAAVPNRS